MREEHTDEYALQPSAGPDRDPTPSLPVISTTELFRESREILIEHDGERYRLRITRRGKLILQK